MKIGLASDHRGYQLKARLAESIRAAGHEVADYGPESGDSVDYPDFASRVAAGVSDRTIDRGVLVCGTGIGMCIAANKFDGVRAAPCHDTVTAEFSRLHNDANVICLSANQLSEKLADQIVSVWLGTDFEGGRHQRRLDKITDIERGSAVAR